MKIGFIINDLTSMNLEKDTSVYLMKEAYKRGNQVFAFDSKDITHKESAIFAECKKCMLIRKQNMHAKLLIALSKKELSEIEKCQYLMDSCNKICLSGVRH